MSERRSSRPEDGSSAVSYRDLAALPPGVFFKAVCRALLGRDPDVREEAEVRDFLMTGRLSKAECFWRLQRRPEVRTRGVSVSDRSLVWWGVLVRKIPLMGRIVRIVDGLQARLEDLGDRACLRDEMTTMAAEMRVVQETISSRLAAAEESLERLAAFTSSLQETVGGLSASVGMIEDHLREVVHPRLNASDDNLEAFQAETRAALWQIRERLDPLVFKDVLGHLRDQAQAIALMRQSLADLHRLLVGRTGVPGGRGSTPGGPETTSEAGQAMVDPKGSERAWLDALYTSLEDMMRGSAEELEQRLRFYLPYVRGVPLNMAPVPLVDAGCGRGEWLALLRAEGIAGIGVDVNALMVERCRDQALPVFLQDAATYLRALGPGTVGAVTAFQLIEHLDLSELVDFLDAAYEALMPGGLLLCETPNPENLGVSVYSFHLDPTHRHPIPPPTAKFFLESRGYCGVSVLRPPAVGEPPEGLQGLPPALRKWFESSQDYAVLGYKPPCDHRL